MSVDGDNAGTSDKETSGLPPSSVKMVTATRSTMVKTTSIVKGEKQIYNNGM